MLRPAVAPALLVDCITPVRVAQDEDGEEEEMDDEQDETEEEFEGDATEPEY